MADEGTAPLDALARVTRLELRLLDPTVRAQASEVQALLHPEFVEFGASGRRLDAPTIAAALAEDTDRGPIEARDLDPVRLADDVVLLTYTAYAPGRVSVRSSVWVRDAGGAWRLRFHQGTPATHPGG